MATDTTGLQDPQLDDSPAEQDEQSFAGSAPNLDGTQVDAMVKSVGLYEKSNREGNLKEVNIAEELNNDEKARRGIDDQTISDE